MSQVSASPANCKLTFNHFFLIGFEHSSFVFAQEANMHENRFNEYRIPSGMLIVFLEKALTLIHMETHLDDVSIIKLNFGVFLFAI